MLVFVTLARASGVSAKYVETIDEEWLKNGEGNNISGHQYTQIYDEESNTWIWVNPSEGKINNLSPENDHRAVFKVGLDSWDIGILDYDSLSQVFNQYRKERLRSNQII